MRVETKREQQAVIGQILLRGAIRSQICELASDDMGDMRSFDRRRCCALPRTVIWGIMNCRSVAHGDHATASAH
eukprot:COSAG06_NODE_257_length_18972_cov_14.659196_12_plen_74_part_00